MKRASFILIRALPDTACSWHATRLHRLDVLPVLFAWTLFVLLQCFSPCHLLKHMVRISVVTKVENMTDHKNIQMLYAKRD